MTLTVEEAEQRVASLRLQARSLEEAIERLKIEMAALRQSANEETLRLALEMDALRAKHRAALTL